MYVVVLLTEMIITWKFCILSPYDEQPTESEVIGFIQASKFDVDE